MNKLALFVLLFAALALSNHAALAHSDLINACADKKTGTIRLVDSPKSCRKTEVPISWNRMGPQGLPGIEGPQGVQGPQGEVGPKGEQGPLRGEWPGLVINFLVALGTVALALLAAGFFKAPKLTIKLHTPTEAYVIISNQKDSTKSVEWIYYHLIVVNTWKPVTVRNCCVYVKKIYEEISPGNFQEISIPVPLPYFWSPSQYSQQFVQFTRERVFDFGRVARYADNSELLQFEPVLFTPTQDFKGVMKGKGVFRYCLEVTAENFSSSKLQTFQVDWNGNWGPGNVNITEITDGFPYNLPDNPNGV
ncbi:MAG: collagen-like protein [Syntrophobacteraceae bacterium]|jgi:hypothetical protein